MPNIQGFEAVVIGRQYHSQEGKCFYDGLPTPPGWKYKVDPDPDPVVDLPWNESALRKRPSEFDSFESLMESLKTPVDV